MLSLRGCIAKRWSKWDAKGWRKWDESTGEGGELNWLDHGFALVKLRIPRVSTEKSK